MPTRTPVTPRQRLDTLLRSALADPLAGLPLLPLNRAEWQRIDRLYRPLLEDLVQRLGQARTAEEIDALARIASGLVEQRQAELDELRRYVDPPTRREPDGVDSSRVGLEVATSVLATLDGALDEGGAEQAAARWEVVTFLGLAPLRPTLTELAHLFGDQAGQVALATRLGFPFRASHTSVHQLAQRVLLGTLLRQRQCHAIHWSPIPARYRPPWDVWAPESGIVGSVQPDLRVAGLGLYGSTVLWSQPTLADDGLGYLVLVAHLEPSRPNAWLSQGLAEEQVHRQRWQHARLEAMLPRPGRKIMAQARRAITELESAFERLLDHSRWMVDRSGL